MRAPLEPQRTTATATRQSAMNREPLQLASRPHFYGVYNTQCRHGHPSSSTFCWWKTAGCLAHREAVMRRTATPKKPAKLPCPRVKKASQPAPFAASSGKQKFRGPQDKTVWYPAVLRQEGGSGVGVDFPDFPGCISCGADINEALCMAAQALDLHAEDLQTLPDPTPISDVKTKEQLIAVALVPLKPRRRVAQKSVRLQVTLPQSLDQQLAQVALSRHDTKSGILAEALRRFL